jgi:hypothetical protein
MFFHVSKSVKNNFPYNHQTKNFVISLDEGWSQTKDSDNNDIWYKGYLDQGQLFDSVLDIADEEEPKHHGNFCVIKVFDQGLTIRADRLRSFPLYYSATDGLTNLTNVGETYWSDSYVMMTNDMSLVHSKFDAIGKVDSDLLTLDQVLDQVDQILDTKTQQFVSQLDRPLRVFLSGGIDTALVFSYIQKYTDNYELILGSHCDFDYFYLKNHGNITNHWGYNQIHHWRENCFLASGAPGDEFTARSPTTANLLLLQRGLNIPQLLQQPNAKNWLHYTYYNRQKYLDDWDRQIKDFVPASFEDTVKLCCNYNINDWQHWHLGQTLTWTPLRDLEIFKLIARLCTEDLVGQVMDSVVQRELIKRNNPDILTYLSTQKNALNYMENLTNLL